MKHRDEDPYLFERMNRGELSRVVAYESSLEGIKDSLFARQHHLGDTVLPKERKGQRVMEAPIAPQVSEDEVSSKNLEAVFRLRSLIADIKTSMLTTIDRDGTLRSRPMLTLAFQDDGSLWFFSADHYGKADDIEGDRRANVTYAVPDKKRFVSVSGEATIIHDEVKKRQLWQPELSEWFPAGSADPHLALLRVQIQKAEYWDVPSNQILEILSFTRAVLTGGTYHTAEPHQKIWFTQDKV